MFSPRNLAGVDKCKICHRSDARGTRLFDDAPEFKEEGVTCKVCHGPGSEYKSLSIMKDHEKSVANGLIEYKNQEEIKQQCLTCHENAHGVPELKWFLKRTGCHVLRRTLSRYNMT